MSFPPKSLRNSPAPRAGSSLGYALAGFAALCALALTLAACRINGAANGGTFLTVEADDSLLACSRVVVILSDSSDVLIDTLFDDSLLSMADLENLPAGAYHGGPARVTVLGYRGAKLVHGETRVYDGATQRTLALEIETADSTPVVSKPSSNPHIPAIDSLLVDTIVSISDPVRMKARISDPDGDLVAWSLACDGKPASPESTAVVGYEAKVSVAKAFSDSGNHYCEMKAWDRAGHVRVGRVGIRVEWDPPTADAGKDTTVTVGSKIRLHGKGDDGFGPIYYRDWQAGNGPWVRAPSQEFTQNAPNEPGEIAYVLKVTDSDGLTALDTLIVTVVPAAPVAD
jgi:hypothetical protein